MPKRSPFSAAPRIAVRLLVCLVAWSAASLVSASSIITVGTVNEQDRVALGGTVIPYQKVTFTAQVPGRVEYVAGDVGDAFDPGDLLVGINDADIQAQRRAAQAKLSNAQAVLRNTRVQYERELYSPSRSDRGGLFGSMMPQGMANAFGMGNTPVDRRANLYSQYTGVDQARAAVEQARSHLEQLAAKLQDTRSTAPFAGIIMSKPVEAGDTVQPGQALVTFGHTKYLRIKAKVPTRLVKNLKVGMRVPAKLDIMDNRIDTRVAQIYPLADPGRHTVTVKFDLPIDAPGGPGMYAEILVPDDGPSAGQSMPVIPASAVLRGGSLPSVLVVNDKGQSELRLIRLGSRMDGDRVRVLSGLKVGARIVNEPPAGASSGWLPETAAKR